MITEGVEAAVHVVVLIRRMVRIVDGREVGLVVDGCGTGIVFHLGDGGAGVVHVVTVAVACKAGSATVVTLLVVRGLGLRRGLGWDCDGEDGDWDCWESGDEEDE
jgi:hypothetical protein